MREAYKLTKSIEVHDCKVVRLFPDRYYGFADMLGTNQTAYFHTYSFDDNSRKALCFDYQFRAQVILDSLSGSYQVRKIVEK
jgi:hypothetical protein